MRPVALAEYVDPVGRSEPMRIRARSSRSTRVALLAGLSLTVGCHSQKVEPPVRADPSGARTESPAPPRQPQTAPVATPVADSPSLAPAPASGSVSAAPVAVLFTDLSAELCPKKASGEEGYWQTFTCEGPPGYDVVLRYEDARDYVEVTPPGGKSLVVDLAPLVRTFRAIGPKAEWRLPTGGVGPVGLIFRVQWSVRDDAGQELERRNVLAVARVTQDEACLVGVVDAARHLDANQRASRLADERLQAPCPAPGQPLVDTEG